MSDDSYRHAVRAFVAARIAPAIEEWERAGAYPASLHAEAGAAGLLAFGEPPGPAPVEHPARRRILIEEITRGGSQGLTMGLASHGVSLAILAQADPDWAGPVIRTVQSGERTIALALTEPQAGSDLAALRARAEPVADGWTISGEKRFICNGTRADCLVVGAVTEAGLGLFLVERPQPGLTAEPLAAAGWRCLPLSTPRNSEY